jgi:hypothetical protein
VLTHETSEDYVPKYQMAAMPIMSRTEGTIVTDQRMGPSVIVVG